MRKFDIIGISLYSIIQFGLLLRFWGKVPLIWAAALFLLALAASDLISALLHWTMDTWFEPSTPLIGILVRPFREHHVDPDQILSRDWISTWGGPCWFASLILLPCFWAAPMLAFFLSWVATFATQADTVHRWSHQRTSPWAITRWMQRVGILQRPADHDRHHVPPHKQGWATLTGWWNPVLNAILPRVESVFRW